MRDPLANHRNFGINWERCYGGHSSGPNRGDCTDKSVHFFKTPFTYFGTCSVHLAHYQKLSRMYGYTSVSITECMLNDIMRSYIRAWSAYTRVKVVTCSSV